MRSRTLRFDELPGDVLTVREVAGVLGVAENTVYTAIRADQLHAVRVGRRLLIGRAALVRFLEGPTAVNDGRKLTTL